MKRSEKHFLPTDNISKIHWNRSKTLAVTAVFSFDPINSPISRKFAFYPISLGSAPLGSNPMGPSTCLSMPLGPRERKENFTARSTFTGG